MADTDTGFGIPISKGNILSQTDIGYILTFNLEHLLLHKLFGGQLFTKNKYPLSLMVSPCSIIEIYQYPLVLNAPILAIAQKESNVIVFIKSKEINEDLRLVFWFKRYPRTFKNDYDLVDVPEQ
jgi:hypothetical protein